MEISELCAYAVHEFELTGLESVEIIRYGNTSIYSGCSGTLRLYLQTYKMENKIRVVRLCNGHSRRMNNSYIQIRRISPEEATIYSVHLD